jgi:hypothetical protein
MQFSDRWGSGEDLSMENRQWRPSMTPRYRTEQAQLPLPFRPSPIARLSGEDRTAALMVLAQLLLAAVGANPEEPEDER